MKSIYISQVHKFLSKKLIFLWIVLIIFNLDMRLNSTLSSQQFIIESLSDHYYTIYFMIPMFLLILISSLDEDENKYVLIRCNTYWDYFKSKIFSYGVFSTIFVISQLIILLIMSIGLNSNSGFKNINSELYSVLYFYSGKFNNTTETIFFITIYMILGLFMTCLIISTISNYFSKKASIKIIIFIYLLCFISIKVKSLKLLSFFFINNYIILHHSFILGFGPIQNLLIELLLILILCKINKDYWNKKLSLKNIYRNLINSLKIKSYHNKYIFNKKNIFSIIFILILMSTWKMISLDSSTINEYLLNVFSGSIIGEFNIFTMLEMLVLNLAPVYILSIFLEKECNDRTIFFNIRLRTSLVWFKSIMISSLKFLLLYTILNILIPISIGTLSGLNYEEGLYNLIFIIFITKILSIAFEFLALFLVYSFTQNVSISFFSLISFNLLSVFPFKLMYYLPFGIASLYRYKFILNSFGVEGGLYLYTAILELLALIMLITLYLNFRHKRLIIK